MEELVSSLGFPQLQRDLQYCYQIHWGPEWEQRGLELHQCWILADLHQPLPHPPSLQRVEGSWTQLLQCPAGSSAAAPAPAEPALQSVAVLTQLQAAPSPLPQSSVVAALQAGPHSILVGRHAGASRNKGAPMAPTHGHGPTHGHALAPSHGHDDALPSPATAKGRHASDHGGIPTGCRSGAREW